MGQIGQTRQTRQMRHISIQVQNTSAIFFTDTIVTKMELRVTRLVPSTIEEAFRCFGNINIWRPEIGADTSEKKPLMDDEKTIGRISDRAN